MSYDPTDERSSRELYQDLCRAEQALADEREKLAELQDRSVAMRKHERQMRKTLEDDLAAEREKVRVLESSIEYKDDALAAGLEAANKRAGELCTLAAEVERLRTLVRDMARESGLPDLSREPMREDYPEEATSWKEDN